MLKKIKIKMEIKYVKDSTNFPGEIIMDGQKLLEIISIVFLVLTTREEKELFLDALKRQINSYRGIQSIDASSGELLFDPVTNEPIYGFDLAYEEIISTTFN